MYINYLIKAIIVIIGLVLLKKSFQQITLFEYERGLKYHKGKFKGIVEPGQYFYCPFITIYKKIDMRQKFVSISGQEVLSSDNVTLKVSLAARYQVVDPNLAVNGIQDYQEALHLELQLALREIIGTAMIDTLLEKRNEFSKQLAETTEKKIQELGLKLISINIKDIMFPGQLKEMFAQVVKAQKEGMAALEKARGETAALRSLANAAKYPFIKFQA